jgi:hypothetical protein
MQERFHLCRSTKKVAAKIETFSPNRWFVPIKPNVINNFNLNSPMGISDANSIDVLKSPDLTLLIVL